MPRNALRIPAIVLLGVFIGVVVFGALSFGIRALSNGGVGSVLESEEGLAQEFGPGFVGSILFGDWRLTCAAGPTLGEMTLPALDSPDLGLEETRTLNACRLSHEALDRDRPERVILVANLSLVGLRARPALMLRLPATLREGDPVTIRVDGVDAVATVARDCTPGECVVASSLSEEEWSRLIAANVLQIVFPLADGQRVAVNLGVDGLGEAAAALRLAQSAPDL